jgi:uncharacterized protein YbaP (TraB family)
MDLLKNEAVHSLLVGFLVAAFTCATALAQEGSKPEAAPAELQFAESTSLWKVETDTSVVYLMGSIHLLKESDFPLHPKMMEAYDRAGTLVLEMEADSIQTPGFQRNLLAKATYDSGKTLETELGDSVYSLLETQVGTLGLALDQMKQFEPWMISLTFIGLKLQQLGFNPDLGVDVYFNGKAKADGKPVRGLEAVGYQIDMFDSMPPSLQRAMVLQTLEQASNVEKTIDAMLLHWRNGDLEGLDATVNRSLENHPELRHLLLTKRNHDWIPKIEGYIGSRGTHLIIMGVSHMSGEEGVVALLRQAGHKVEQM